ncbi:MAG: hypothetical protein IPK37_12690 [Austwickia sp.]|nr:MAG: hypothetical protein IPK37_12690 [Austwickia sp.]
MKPRLTPRLGHCGAAAALVVAATGLAGCGSADPSAAAIVDGQVIKDADLWSVIHDLAKVPRNAEIGVGEVLPVLIQAEVVRNHAAELKAPAASAEAARLQLRSLIPAGQPEPVWSDATVSAFQDAASLGPVLNGPSQAKAVELIQKADIAVNPRYGEFDRKQLTLASATPNWMAPMPPAPPQPEPTQPQPGQPQPGGNPSTLPAPTGSPAPGGAPATPATPAPAASTPAPTTSK